MEEEIIAELTSPEAFIDARGQPMPLDYFENDPHPEVVSKSAAIARNEARAKKEEVAIDGLLGQAGCVSASPRSVVRRHPGLVDRNA